MNKHIFKTELIHCQQTYTKSFLVSFLLKTEGTNNNSNENSTPKYPKNEERDLDTLYSSVASSIIHSSGKVETTHTPI